MLQTFALRAHRQVKLDKVIGHQLPVGGFPLRIDDKRHLFAHLLEQGPVGLSASKAVLADPPRYRDYWHWPTASKLLKEADRIGFDHQVQYGMWKGYGGATQWNDAGLDFATAGKPLLEWAAEERGRPASELPAHADWLAEGAALTQTGRQMEESVGKGFADRIAAALRRIVRSLGLDEAERFREAAVRHEAQARALGIDPRDRPGAVELAGWARALRGRALPKRVRRTVEAWSDGNETRAPDPEETHRRPPQHPEHEEAGRRIETFLRDCRDHLGEAVLAGEELIPESWIERTEALRREGLRMLGDGEEARLADPARIRLGHVAQERERVREVVDALGEKVQRLRAEAFMALHRRVDRQRREAGSEPVDLPGWAPLRDRAEALRGEAGLAPGVLEALDTVLARDAWSEVESAPVDALLTATAEHLHRRAALEKEARELEVEISGLAAMPGWRTRSRELRDAARRLLGETQGNAPAMRAGARLADMPRLQARVREVVDRLETVRLTDNVADFRSLANAVEGRARQLRTLPLHADGYARVTALAEGLAKREVLPDAVRHEVGGWVERDRGWRAELASVRELTGAEATGRSGLAVRSGCSGALCRSGSGGSPSSCQPNRRFRSSLSTGAGPSRSFSPEVIPPAPYVETPVACC